ncbi:MAG: helix-turn-helix transcriptional regulator [Chloroflexota bacterium]|nr:helix-turn-helix transcriptional regulator [Chloroflexota bacterium]
MPRGGRRRRGKGGGASPWRIYRFVQPCLLLLLHRAPSHGYSLIEDLKEFGFERCPVDASMVYRSLRDMEEQGLVVSHWDTEGPGPPRRVYRLTAQGDQYLAWWVADLQETDRVLHNFFDAYDEHMRKGKGEHH